MRNGILYGAYHFAVAVEAYDVCDVVVFVKEKVHAHNHHRVERFGWGGELGVFGKFLIEVVFEFFQSKGQEVVFVLEVSVERGSVDHRFVAKVDDADFSMDSSSIISSSVLLKSLRVRTILKSSFCADIVPPNCILV